MNNRCFTLTSMASLAIVVTSFLSAASAQRVLLTVDRSTGEVNAISSSEIAVDGYSISSAAGRLDVEGWNGLNEQGDAAWLPANPTNTLLSELNWEGSGALAATPIPLGAAYNGTGVFPTDEDLQFDYSMPDGSVNTGLVIYSGASVVPTVSVDRETGIASISNPAGFELTGYTIASAAGALNSESFSGLASQGQAGWAVANPTNSHLSEVNLQMSTVFDSTTSFDLGSIYAGQAEDLSFEYTTTDGLGSGLVSYTGPAADLTLQVDLISGEATIQNPSARAGDFDVIGYSLSSDSGGLSVSNWSAFTDSGAAGGGWSKANPTTAALAELNAAGSNVFSAGDSISLGSVFVGTAQDLALQYSTADGTVANATVEYVVGGGGPSPPVCDPNTGGDLDGDGSVGFPDFLILSANFGQTVADHTSGDIDCNGDVGFPDFLVLSANFGTTVGAQAASVPEPSSAVLAMLGTLVLLSVRRKQR